MIKVHNCFQLRLVTTNLEFDPYLEFQICSHRPYSAYKILYLESIPFSAMERKLRSPSWPMGLEDVVSVDDAHVDPGTPVSR